MKIKFKLIILLIAIGVIQVQAGDYTKDIHKGYDKAVIQSLSVSNKYGEIKVNDLGGDSITVDVLISIESASENKAEYLFDQIDISINKRGSELVLETKFKDSFKTKQHFTIDYLVNIPADRNLKIANKYGNVDINELNASGNFEIAYGSIHAGNLVDPAGNPIKLSLSYSKADLESFDNMTCYTKYSKLYIGDANKLKVESKYSTINAELLGELYLESKYDGVNIEQLKSLKANSSYTNYKLGTLEKSFILNTKYGSVRINELGSEFDLIDLNNSYGGITIGIGDLSFNIEADCDYCDIKLPEGGFTGNRNKDGHHLKLVGGFGSSNTGATIKINSRYGGVKLTN